MMQMTCNKPILLGLHCIQICVNLNDYGFKHFVNMQLNDEVTLTWMKLVQTFCSDCTCTCPSLTEGICMNTCIMSWESKCLMSIHGLKLCPHSLYAVCSVATCVCVYMWFYMYTFESASFPNRMTNLCQYWSLVANKWLPCDKRPSYIEGLSIS